MTSKFNQTVEALQPDDFPFGVCPFMSGMTALLVPVSSRVQPANGQAMQQQLTFTPAPCLGQKCCCWSVDRWACGIVRYYANNA